MYQLVGISSGIACSVLTSAARSSHASIDKHISLFFLKNMQMLVSHAHHIFCLNPYLSVLEHGR
jgi:hypothetical protein